MEVRKATQQTFLDLALNLMEEGSGLHQSTWWVGATNGGVEDGPWYWESNGDSVDDDIAGTWQFGEPRVGEGNCAVMESVKGYTWKATPCGMIASVVCQIDGPSTSQTSTASP